MLSNAYMLIMVRVILMFVGNYDDDYVDDNVVMTLIWIVTCVDVNTW